MMIRIKKEIVNSRLVKVQSFKYVSIKTNMTQSSISVISNIGETVSCRNKGNIWHFNMTHPEMSEQQLEMNWS